MCDKMAIFAYILKIFLFILFKILKTFTKMLHTNLIGCRGKTKRNTKYNISTLKGTSGRKQS